MTVAIATMTVLMMISFGPVRGEKQEVPSSPGSGFDFDDVDTDRSGCVEGTEELQNFRLHVGKILGEALKLNKVERALRAERITHSADVNGDGRICQCDLLSILLAESTGPGKHQHAFRVYEDGSFFDDVDTDGDGVLADVTEKERMTQKLAQCVPGEQAARIVDAMAKLHKDDGKLTRGEYLLFLKSTPRAIQPTPHPFLASPSFHHQPLPRFRLHAMPQPQPQPQPQQQPQPQPQPQPQQQELSQVQQQQSTDSEAEGRPKKRMPASVTSPQSPVPVNLARPQSHFQPMASSAGQREGATHRLGGLRALASHLPPDNQPRLENLDSSNSGHQQHKLTQPDKQHNEAAAMQQQQHPQLDQQSGEDGNSRHEHVVPDTAQAAADSHTAPQPPKPKAQSEAAGARQETHSLSQQLADVQSSGQEGRSGAGSKTGSVDQSLENELLENRA